jgi:hypothetical protein
MTTTATTTTRMMSSMNMGAEELSERPFYLAATLRELDA